MRDRKVVGGSRWESRWGEAGKNRRETIIRIYVYEKKIIFKKRKVCAYNNNNNNHVYLCYRKSILPTGKGYFCFSKVT